ncbi:glycosyl transferase, group 1 [Lunatimonas lonarensis]|uniref:Glycosyl transferase, group 1 n=1 Tax=Lunatimonas lonarensis TaxID=1232681 RepID=R7ZN57_9BACT|nr:glycosyltransferase family 1 protein [Lunatimonas lonarensis]EON75536.1 glycosyl transferase, group 1 [Lunatimonas lonarensis]
MGKLRVGFDCRDLFIAQTGTRTFSEELLDEIRKDPMVELVPLSPSGVILPKGLVSKAFAHIQFIVWKVFLLPLMARQTKVDFLICPDYVAPFWFLGRIKTLPVFHGCNIWELPQNYNSVWRLYFSFLARLGQRRAFRVLTVSSFSKRKLTEVLGIPASRITVMPIGAKTLEKAADRSDNAERPLSGEYILHVGVLDKRKNLPALIKAFSLLPDQQLHLVLVGGRPSKIFMDSYPEIQATVDELNLTDRVHLMGYVSDDRLPLFYKHAKAYVFPSVYEGFGIPVLEAFQYHLPLAASGSASLPEVVGTGGMLFDPGDIKQMAGVIERLLALTPVELDLLRCGQMKALSHYSWPNAWNTVKEVMNGK